MSKQVLLGDISELKTGPFGTQLHADEYVPEGTPVINVRNIGNGEILADDIDKVSEETLFRLTEHKLCQNDIVFGRKGSIDRHAFIDERYAGWMQGSDCIRVRITDEDINPRYISHYLKLNSVKKQLVNGAVGSTMPSMNTDILKSIIISVPDKKTQDNIEQVFSTLEGMIANNTAICSNLEAIAKLLYDYWFVQFDFPDENGKPYKSSGGKMVWNEELKREIPEGWEVKPLGEIVTESSKSTIQVNGAKADGLYPFFTSGNAILAYDEYFVDGFHCFLNTGGNPDIKGYKGKCAYSTDTWCIDAGRYSYFMYQYFMLIMPQFEQLFFAGSGLKHLQKDVLKKQCVALPSLEVIGEFNAFLDDLWNKRTACFLENQQLASLRDFLLPMLMNGQVKVGKENDR